MMEKNASFFDPEFWNDLDRLAKGVCFRDGAPMPRLTTASSARLPIDLYLWWFERIKFRTSKPSVGKFPPTFSFIAEGDVVGFRDWAEQQSQDKNSEAYIPVRIPEEYLEVLSATGKPARYFTFDLKVPGKKQWLAAPGYTHGRQNNAEIDSVLLGKRLKRLITCGHITRLQLGFPLGSAQADETEPDATHAFVSPEEQLDYVKAAADVVIGVIDDGAAFAHASLREPRSKDVSRVKIVWNQSPHVNVLNKSHWQHPATALTGSKGELGAWYGAMMAPNEIASAMSVLNPQNEVDELRCYADLLKRNKTRRALHSRESHGAAVLTCVAGSFDAANVIPPEVDPICVDASAADALFPLRSRQRNDKASQAPLIFVDLPFELTGFSSGRWMSGAALDGVRFIVRQARSRFKGILDGEVPVVINISSGSSAGNHSGTSMFESALEEILKADHRLAVTLAAGNSRLAHTHLDATVGTDLPYEVVVRVPPDKPSETYAEIWPESIGGSHDFSADTLAGIFFYLKSPDGAVLGPIKAGEGEAVFRDDDGDAVAGLKFAANAAQARDRPMALLVVAPTAVHEWRPRPQYGNWIVRCVNKSGAPLRLRAWIERDEIVFGIRQPQLAHFVHADQFHPQTYDWEDKTPYDISRGSTVSNFANAPGAFAVAAGVGGRDTGYVSPYSGGGEDALAKKRPEFIARADRSPAQPGIPVFGNYGSARRHMNGTSIAAPQVARWIANYMALGHDRPSIECLVQFSKPRTHPHLREPAVTGVRQVAAGEGNWFVDPADERPELCLGKERKE